MARVWTFLVLIHTQLRWFNCFARHNTPRRLFRLLSSLLPRSNKKKQEIHTHTHKHKRTLRQTVISAYSALLCYWVSLLFLCSEPPRSGQKIICLVLLEPKITVGRGGLIQSVGEGERMSQITGVLSEDILALLTRKNRGTKCIFLFSCFLYWVCAMVAR